MSELAKDSKAEYTGHMKVWSTSPHGLIEVQLLRYAKLRELDQLVQDFFENDTGNEQSPKRMSGSCYQLSALIRLSKKMEEKPRSSTMRDDFPRIQAYIKAILAWKGSQKELIEKINGLDETLEVAFSRIIGYIWQICYIDRVNWELATTDGVVQHKIEYEYSAAFFFDKSEEFVVRLLKLPTIFRENRQVEITLMPCVEYSTREVIDTVGHMINASKTSLGFSLEDSRNKTPFQHFAATDYEGFLKAIFAAGEYQLCPEDFGLCISFNVEKTLQIARSPTVPKPTQLDKHTYPSPTDLWPKADELSEKEKNLLLLVAAKYDDRLSFDFWLSQIKTVLVTEAFQNWNVVYWLLASDNRDQLIKLFNKLKSQQLSASFLTDDQERDLADIREKIQGDLFFLHIAAGQNCSRVIEPLVKFGYDPFALDENEMTAFMLAAAYGSLEVAKELFKLDPTHLNFRSPKKGYTALHWAVHLRTSSPKQLKLLRELLKMGADQNIACNEGCLPFYLAAKRGNIEAMKILLSAAASPALKLKIIKNENNEGDSAISYLKAGDNQAAREFVFHRLEAEISLLSAQSAVKELGLAEIETPPKLTIETGAEPITEAQVQQQSLAVLEVKSRPVATAATSAQASFFAKTGAYMPASDLGSPSTTGVEHSSSHNLQLQQSH